jgi:hypothetical protein
MPTSPPDTDLPVLPPLPLNPQLPEPKYERLESFDDRLAQAFDEMFSPTKR